MIFIHLSWAKQSPESKPSHELVLVRIPNIFLSVLLFFSVCIALMILVKQNCFSVSLQQVIVFLSGFLLENASVVFLHERRRLGYIDHSS